MELRRTSCDTAALLHRLGPLFVCVLLASCSKPSPSVVPSVDGAADGTADGADDSEAEPDTFADDAQACEELYAQAADLYSAFDESSACTEDSQCVKEGRSTCAGPMCGVVLHVDQVEAYADALAQAGPICDERGELMCPPSPEPVCVSGEARCVEGTCQFSEGFGRPAGE